MSTRKERKARRKLRDSLTLGTCPYSTHELRYLTPALNQCIKCGAVYRIGGYTPQG